MGEPMKHIHDEPCKPPPERGGGGSAFGGREMRGLL